MRALSRALSAAALIMLAGLYIELPGPWRALTPTAFGLARIAPGVYTDAPREAPKILSLIDRSRQKAEALFGRGSWQPTYVVCTADPCTKTFGFRSAGLTVGYHLVLISPQGINEEVMLHERVHVELHRRMGPLDLVKPRFPMWFDEGLATFLSRPPPVRGRADPARAAWVRQADTWSRWQAMARDRPVDQLYAAAAVLVGQMQQTLGRGGLFALIAKVGHGADFNTLYAETLRG